MEQASVQSSTGYWVTRLARVMEGDFEKRLGPYGVTRASCAILNAIFYDKQSTPAALASFVGIDGAAITRHLDRLEKQGLIEREPSPTDRRSVILTLTRKGTRLAPKLAAKSQETNTKFLAGLTRSERESFHQIAQKMLANADLTPGDL